METEDNGSTNLSWARVWIKLTSSSRLVLVLNVANQSTPSVFNSANMDRSNSSRNGAGTLSLATSTGNTIESVIENVLFWR